MDEKKMLALLQSEDTAMQREGAFMAGEAGSEEAIPFLARMLTSPSLGIQEAADISLREIGGKAVVKAMIPLLRSENVPARNLAMDILRKVGHQDVGTLIALLQDEDPDIRIFASDILGYTNNVMALFPLCESMLNDKEVNVRYQAAISLGELGKPEAIPALKKALGEDEWVNFAIFEALRKIGGEDATAALLDVLGTSSELEASVIVEALGASRHLRAIPTLIKFLDESGDALRNRTLKAIVDIMGYRTLSLLSNEDRISFSNRLFEAAEDKDATIQDAVILGLSSVGGEKACEKIFSLIQHIDPESQDDRYARAVDALVFTGFTDVLCQMAHAEDAKISKVAVEVLLRLATPEANQVCINVFWDKERDLRRLIAKTLASTEGASAIPFFRRILHEVSDGDVLKSALHFLGKRMRCKDCVQEMVPFLRHQFKDVQEKAVLACVAIGGEEVEAIFCSMLKDEDASQRMLGALGLGQIEGPKYLKEFEAALSDEAVGVRKAAMEALVERCSWDKDLLMRMASRMIKDESREIRSSLVNLMGTRRCTGTLPLLVQALDDEDQWIQACAADALGALGSEGAIEPLIALLERGSKLIRIKVVNTLGQIGGQKALQELLKILESKDSELQEAAEQALELMQAIAVR